MAVSLAVELTTPANPPQNSLDLLRNLVTQIFTSWNQTSAWLRRLEALRLTA
jgi:hypothetical protein